MRWFLFVCWLVYECSGLQTAIQAGQVLPEDTTRGRKCCRHWRKEAKKKHKVRRKTSPQPSANATLDVRTTLRFHRVTAFDWKSAGADPTQRPAEPSHNSASEEERWKSPWVSRKMFSVFGMNLLLRVQAVTT